MKGGAREDTSGSGGRIEGTWEKGGHTRANTLGKALVVLREERRLKPEDLAVVDTRGDCETQPVKVEQAALVVEQPGEPEPLRRRRLRARPERR